MYLFIYLFIHLLIWFQTFNKKLIPTQNSTHYKEFITVFTNLYLRVKKLFCTSSCINQDFTLSFSISFVIILAILLILCIISPWVSASVHSPSVKELNPPSPLEDARFSIRCTLAYKFSLYPALSLLGTQQQSRSSSGKELNRSSQGLIYCCCIILSGLSLV